LPNEIEEARQDNPVREGARQDVVSNSALPKKPFQGLQKIEPAASKARGGWFNTPFFI